MSDEEMKGVAAIRTALPHLPKDLDTDFELRRWHTACKVRGLVSRLKSVVSGARLGEGGGGAPAPQNLSNPIQFKWGDPYDVWICTTAPPPPKPNPGFALGPDDDLARASWRRRSFRA